MCDVTQLTILAFSFSKLPVNIFVFHRLPKLTVADPGGPQGAMAPPNDGQNFFNT